MTATGPSTSADPSAGPNGTSAETGTTMADSDGTASDSGTDSGDEVCSIQLPPPAACNSAAPVQPPPMKAIGGSRALRVQGTSDMLDDDGHARGGGNFIDVPDDPPGSECSTFEQDCPDGFKCMPWANDGGGSWNATRCAPLDPNAAQVGDPCSVEGSGVSGVDNCELGAMCWRVDAATNTGTCIELCGCSAENPICETPNSFCSITNQGALAICLSVCNPLDPDSCSEGDGCYFTSGYFVCAADASGEAGNVGDPCQFLNVCNPGLMCVAGSSFPGCNAQGCCSSLCTVGDDSPCVDGQACVAMYDEGQAPDACLAEVGACVIP